MVKGDATKQWLFISHYQRCKLRVPSCAGTDVPDSNSRVRLHTPRAVKLTMVEGGEG